MKGIKYHGWASLFTRPPQTYLAHYLTPVQSDILAGG